MATKYHRSKGLDGRFGRKVVPCRATIRPCPIGGAHYEFKHEALAANIHGEQTFWKPLRLDGAVLRDHYVSQMRNAFVTSTGEATAEINRWMDRKRIQAVRATIKELQEELAPWDGIAENPGIAPSKLGEMFGNLRIQQKQESNRVRGRNYVPSDAAVSAAFFREDQKTFSLGNVVRDRFDLIVEELKVKERIRLYGEVSRAITEFHGDKGQEAVTFLDERRKRMEDSLLESREADRERR